MYDLCKVLQEFSFLLLLLPPLHPPLVGVVQGWWRMLDWKSRVLVWRVHKD